MALLALPSVSFNLPDTPPQGSSILTVAQAAEERRRRGTSTTTSGEPVELELEFESEGLAVWHDDDDELAAVRDANGVIYEVEEVLGCGATSEVFKVADPQGQRLAMKVVPRGRFMEAEASALQRLEHPNVVRFYGAASAPKYKLAFLFFEFIDGGQLCDMTPDGRLIGERWSEAEARRVFVDLASAVAHLHQNGVVHRDIKPQNCLRRRTGEVVLCDFGASDIPSEKDDTTRRTAGTPFFYPPEASSGQNFGTKAQDAWALAVTLYLLMYGHVPYGCGSRNMLELPERVMCDELALDVPGVNVSPACRDFLRQALEKSLTARIGLRSMLHNQWLTGRRKGGSLFLSDMLLSPANDDGCLLEAEWSRGENDELMSTLIKPRNSTPAWSEEATSFTALSASVSMREQFTRRSATPRDSFVPELDTADDDSERELRVLVANDDTNERNHLVRRITSVSKQGVRHQKVDVCGDSALLKQVIRGSYDIVFMPLHTFCGDAAGVANAIREREATTAFSRRVKLVATAQAPSDEETETALEAGVDEVLETPAHLARLISLLTGVGWATKLRREVDLDTMYDNSSAFDSQCRDYDRSQPPTPSEKAGSPRVSLSPCMKTLALPSPPRQAPRRPTGPPGFNFRRQPSSRVSGSSRGADITNPGSPSFQTAGSSVTLHCAVEMLPTPASERTEANTEVPPPAVQVGLVGRLHTAIRMATTSEAADSSRKETPTYTSPKKPPVLPRV
eukprot:Hpha_TRINITY_DN15600_c0_g4::TRINITY_DN15600_c0_g4_i1::g.97777::m.97777